ncbi:Olfactory receptor 2AJ1 [Sciurus carolinensis]|uniref:Olfactory receptor 2AJ1 n=1 Tax=Sciurus carolinensis TaxID=30640 RepID=A0AA41MXR9_SCICA|nr:Olfactory receptor 2AJ1 [Sciurus carolinensis]
MRPDNLSASTDFLLLGLFSTSHSSLVSFSFLDGIFIVTLMENELMILLIRRDPRLHTPMYFLLSHLSFMDILHISSIIPKVITDFLSSPRKISFTGCGTQVFLCLMMLGGQDKFLAIFYTIIMPTLNPVIYSFWNKDVLMAMKNLLRGSFLYKK